MDYNTDALREAKKRLEASNECFDRGNTRKAEHFMHGAQVLATIAVAESLSAMYTETSLIQSVLQVEVE